MAATTFPTLHPDLFWLIASHLPLHSASPTLFALSLTNHEHYNIARPLLFSRVVLRNEKDILNFTRILVADPSLGNLVQELHVKSQRSFALSLNTNGDNFFDLVKTLMKIIETNTLPNIHALGLYLLTRPWYTDEDNEDLNFVIRYQLPKDFWKILCSKYTRLKSVMLSGVGVNKEDDWLDRTGIYDINGTKNFTSFGLIFQRWARQKRDGPDKLVRNLHLLPSTLHTLVLGLSYINPPSVPLLTLRFPKLQSLTLENFATKESLSQSMAFWRAHPLLQYLKLPYPRLGSSCWFDELDVDSELLPNLKHLHATCSDVYVLAPILHRLTSLSIDNSINAQIPYLLRSVIPTGLPLLKSLGIRQTPGNLDWISQSEAQKGALWYETEDGVFHVPDPEKMENPQEMKEEMARFRHSLDEKNYMDSIVKGAPNLEEISLETTFGGMHPLLLLRLRPHLAKFKHLERLYHPATTLNYRQAKATRHGTEQIQALFYEVAQALAQKCKKLVLVTDTQRAVLPYMAAKIRRDNSGEIEKVVAVEGYGMLIGNEDKPFPKYYDSDLYN